MARRERRRSRRERARDAERQAAQQAQGTERWRRPRGDRQPVAAPVQAPPPVQRLLVDVDGAPVEVDRIRVVGSPSPEELRGSLATLGLDDLDDEVRAAHEAYAASLRAERAPVGAALRALAVVRAVVAWKGWVPIGALAGLGAGFVMLAAPIWFGARPSDELRGELAVGALLTGASGLWMMIVLHWLASEPPTTVPAAPEDPSLGPSSQPRPRPRRTHDRPGIGAGGVVLLVVLLAWMVLPIVLLIVRTSQLGGWSGAIVIGLVLHGAALAAWVSALVRLRRGPSRARPLLDRWLDATPESRLQALERTFRDRIVGLEKAEWTALRSAMETQADRLVAAGAIEEGTRAAMLRVGPTATPFDAALATRIAADPLGPIVLRPHLPTAAVAALARSRPHTAGLVRRIVAAVAAGRQERGAPFDAAVLVDLVAAARVPVLARDAAATVALSRLWPATLVGGWAAAAGAVVATLLWLPSAGDFREPTSPSGGVAFACIAVVLLAVADVRERVARLRSLATTIAWCGLAACAALAATLVDGASAYSPYLRGLRMADAVALGVVAVLAIAAAAWRIVEAVGGRRHDAVHANSSEWPLSRARVADVETHRRRLAGAKGAALDDVAADVEPVLQLAVDLGRLDARVPDSVATGPRRATWPECRDPIWGSPPR